LAGVGEVVGVDPSPDFVDRARRFGEAIDNLTFEAADGRELPFPDRHFDVVAFHGTLCYLPNRQRGRRSPPSATHRRVAPALRCCCDDDKDQQRLRL
jgi:SAM-dependent methyltransferase